MTSPKWTAIIVESDKTVSTSLKNQLQKHCPQINVVAEAAETAEAITYIKNLEPNLLFCNIHLKDGDAFQMLDKLEVFHGYLIFISCNTDSTLRSIRYNAFEYLLKPLSAEVLLNLMERLENKEAQQNRRLEQSSDIGQRQKFSTLILRASGVQHVIHIPDIIHLEGDGNYSTVHLANTEKILVSKPLKYFEDILPAKSFFRVHQSHIVNLANVKNVQGGEEHLVTLNNGSTVPLSRRKKDQFLEWLIR